MNVERELCRERRECKGRWEGGRGEDGGGGEGKQILNALSHPQKLDCWAHVCVCVLITQHKQSRINIK